MNKSATRDELRQAGIEVDDEFGDMVFTVPVYCDTCKEETQWNAYSEIADYTCHGCSEREAAHQIDYPDPGRNDHGRSTVVEGLTARLEDLANAPVGTRDNAYMAFIGAEVATSPAGRLTEEERETIAQHRVDNAKYEDGSPKPPNVAAPLHAKTLAMIAWCEGEEAKKPERRVQQNTNGAPAGTTATGPTAGATAAEVAGLKATIKELQEQIAGKKDGKGKVTLLPDQEGVRSLDPDDRCSTDTLHGFVKALQLADIEVCKVMPSGHVGVRFDGDDGIPERYTPRGEVEARMFVRLKQRVSDTESRPYAIRSFNERTELIMEAARANKVTFETEQDEVRSALMGVIQALPKGHVRVVDLLREAKVTHKPESLAKSPEAKLMRKLLRETGWHPLEYPVRSYMTPQSKGSEASNKSSVWVLDTALKVDRVWYPPVNWQNPEPMTMAEYKAQQAARRKAKAGQPQADEDGDVPF